MKCILCENQIDEQPKVGHNPEPIISKGRCCTKCNDTKVIPLRLYNYTILRDRLIHCDDNIVPDLRTVNKDGGK